MSALASASSAHGPAHRIRRAAVLLECAAPALARKTATAVALALGGASALVFVLGDPSKHASVGVVLAACGVAVLWGAWFARLLLLHVEARQGRVPGLAGELFGAGALAFLLSVPVPALLLAGGGAAAGEAVCVLAAGACVGVLLATMPRIFQLVLCLAPAIAIVAGDVLGLLLPDGLSFAWQPSMGDVAWVLPVLAAACVWRWHGIVHRRNDHLSPWWQPMLLSGAKPGADWGWYSGTRITAQMPDVFWPAGQTAGATPRRPVRTMRALLGTPFAPLSGGQIAVQAGLLVLAFAYVAMAAVQGLRLSMLAGAGVGCAAVMVLMFGQRLEALYSRRSTELDELALLPGLGDPAGQRAHLLGAVLLPAAWVAVFLVGVLAAVVVIAGLGPLHAIVLLLSAAGTILLTVLACLRPISGLSMDGWRMLLLGGPIAVLALAGTTGSMMEGSTDGLLLLGALWIPAFLVLGTMTLSALRRFRRRPHPFLPY